MPNGFPPPSFRVETERTGVFTTARNRWLAAAALLGALLLMAGLLAIAGGGDDKTALKTSPGSTAPPDTEVTFPPSPDIDPLAGNFDAITVPTLPAPVKTVPTVPTVPPVAPSLPGPTVATAPPAVPVAPPAPSPPPGQPPPPANTGPAISPVNGTFIHPDPGVASPCQGPWSVKAAVEDPNGVATVKVLKSTNGEAPVELDLTLRSGTYSLAFPAAPSGRTVLTIRAVDNLGAVSDSPEQSFTCP